MLPVFSHPLAFLGLASVPALVGIYLLHRRYRRVPVSSLMLWLDPRPARQGGTRVERLRTPLLFFLELAALVLLVLAAAEPQVQVAQRARPLAVVLDDSFSMLASEPDSPRARARAALREELAHSARHAVRFVLAGEHPQVLGDPAHTAAEALGRLDGWHCRAPAARLDEAVSLASELAGEVGLVLVLTDRPPPTPPGQGRVQWWSFGRPLPNLAIVTAARTARDGTERCLVEVVNLSDEIRDAVLVVEAGQPATELRRFTARLEPRQVQRALFQLPEGTPAVRARLLGQDALSIDNEVTLLPVRHRPVRVSLRVTAEGLRAVLDKALRASREAVLTEVRPDVVFTDGDPDVPESAWRVQVIADKDAAAYTGPFVINRNHPLAEGLALQGVVWGAGKSAELPGTPVIAAGNVPLVTDVERPGRRHDVRLRLRPDVSTLQDTPAWPVLVYNLLHWEASLAPGLDRPNIRLGEQAVYTFDEARDEVEVVPPEGPPRRTPVTDLRVVVRGDETGVYEVRSPGAQEPLASVAVNALARDESDLRDCATGRWGDWLDETSLRLEYQSVSWVLLLLALGVVTVHLFLVWRGG
jgi:hypothetical protein